MIEYDYDLQGNRISRTVDEETEYFMYLGNNEIGIFDSTGSLKELRVLGLSSHEGLPRAIAIETKEGIFAPIHDCQGKIIRLINISTREVIKLDNIDPFGRGIPDNCPVSWVFFGKNYDKEARLIYFGKRYYSPDLKEWISPDPMKQTVNPYEFCLGNPLSYFDPDGQWAISLVRIAWGAGVAITTPALAPYALAVGAGMTLGYVGSKVYES